MADKRDFYEVLGVSKIASDEEIKKVTGNWHANSILISIKATPRPR